MGCIRDIVPERHIPLFKRADLILDLYAIGLQRSGKLAQLIAT